VYTSLSSFRANWGELVHQSGRSADRARSFGGYGAVEFSLTSLLLMAMFLGTIDLARAIFQRQELANAAREGARFAMADKSARGGGSLADLVASAASRRSPSLGLQAANFQTSGGGQILCEEWDPDNNEWDEVLCSGAKARNRLTVCAGYTFQPIATRLLRLGPITMTDCSRIMIQ
jgi:Flp pilus assembly protein TadG